MQARQHTNYGCDIICTKLINHFFGPGVTEVGQKQKTEKKREERRRKKEKKIGDINGQATQAHMAHASRLGQKLETGDQRLETICHLKC